MLGRLVVGVVLAGSLVGCATSYEKPVITGQVYEVAVVDSDKALQLIKNKLFMRMYALTSDEVSIRTAHKFSELTPEQADCGTTMGIDYLKDSRTEEYVSINVMAESGKIKVVTDIYAKYLVGDGLHGKRMKCVSKGLIEREVLSWVE
ncbi:hypothetical protein [Thiomicrorhabdus lithotrophica]|uniref:Lipoprotein n=1 Tax=Thiomicrorhabdus lithotrophica TaxID=2949997 RepID=A0ABY8C879_9GAMM|nr:hypothetical protein [Thiomicrorhabdus lithotrophica]WEJ62180.1 hypothetical protein NR989_09180 [Thiomicrorhabdus lithotrophica]